MMLGVSRPNSFLRRNSSGLTKKVATIILVLLTGLLILSSGLSVMFAALVFGRQTDTLWARPFGWMALSTAIFMIAYALELNSTGLPQKLIWAKAQYFSTSLIPVFYLLFALGYCESRWSNSRLRGLLFIIPTLTMFFLWFDIGDLVYQSAVLVPSPLGPNVNADYGWWFWIHITVSYLMLAVGAVTLIKKAASPGCISRFSS